MKEDVENLPDKEEVVVWVELTTEQRHFYKAIYGKQVLWSPPVSQTHLSLSTCNAWCASVHKLNSPKSLCHAGLCSGV